VRRAKEVDGELKRERYRSPLQGIPFGAKDLLAVAGHPTTWGAKPYAAQVFDETATVLRKLDKTGSLLIGKLAMVGLAGGGGYRIAGASLFGPGLNPWDRTRWSGGSSSGSGTAVAAGLVPYALGSETSGSIITARGVLWSHRPPAHLWAGEPARCRWRSRGPWTDRPALPQRRGLRLVLETLAGSDSKDPASAGKSFYYTPQYSRKFTDPEDWLRSSGPGVGDPRGEARLCSGSRRGAGFRGASGGDGASRFSLWSVGRFCYRGGRGVGV